jgi:hypothetical protein
MMDEGCKKKSGDPWIIDRPQEEGLVGYVLGAPFRMSRLAESLHRPSLPTEWSKTELMMKEDACILRMINKCIEWIVEFGNLIPCLNIVECWV